MAGNNTDLPGLFILAQNMGQGSIGLPERLTILVVAGLVIGLGIAIVLRVKNAGGSDQNHSSYCAAWIQAQDCRFGRRPGYFR